jgi:alpha-tubulin suppressor-like RCC1 family protein
LANGIFSGRATVSGATTAGLTLTGITTNDQANYVCRVTNTFGSITSSVAALTVYIAPNIIVQPLGRTNAVGTNTTFTVFASGTTPLYYQWQKNETVISYATLNVFTINGLSNNDIGDYSVTVSNPAGQSGSVTAHLLVLNPPKITSQPAGSTNQLGTLHTFSVGATGDFLVYQWRFNGTNLVGAVNSSLTVTNIQYADEGIYTVVVSNSVGSVTSVGASLNLLKPPLIASGPSHILVWGNNSYGQTIVPMELTNVVAVAAGGAHCLALKPDGTVLAWGANAGGQTDVPDGLTNAVAISAGSGHSLALKADGTVVSWGRYIWNGFAYVPGTVPNDLSNVVAIAAGFWHDLALKQDGTVIAWGENSSGQTNVPIGLSNVVAIAAGEYHNLALKADGSVVTWGKYFDGSTYVPATVPIGLSNIMAIAANGYQSLALRPDHTVAAWGSSYCSTFTFVSDPVGITNAVGIAAGVCHGLAIKADGTAFAWGDNSNNQTNVPAWLSGVMTIAGGSSYSLALTRDKLPVGSTFSWQVTASGTPPLAYQWQRNGMDIFGATESLFTKTNAEISDSGNYCVIITNAFGCVTSSVVSITVGMSPQTLMASFVSNQGVKLQMNGTPGFPYAVQTATNLLPPVQWLPVQTNSTDTNGVWQFMDTNLNNAQKFYRVTTP